MLVQPIPKEKYKTKKQKRNGIPKKLVAEVHKRSGGICEYCHSRKATEYPHHLNERGMGGGRGLDILINMLDVCGICHNHDDLEFLNWCDKELEQRIEEEFRGYDGFAIKSIAQRLGMSEDDVISQQMKKFLRCKMIGLGGERLQQITHVSTKEDIKRWLMGKGCTG
jgi:hypothetical protein